MPNLDVCPRNRLAISSKHRILHDKRMAILVGAIVEPGKSLFHWRAHYIQRTFDGARSLAFDATLRVFRIHAHVKETVKAQAWGQQACRSEEHTSELQSLMRISYAVFCLKKKIKNKTY